MIEDIILYDACYTNGSAINCCNYRDNVDKWNDKRIWYVIRQKIYMWIKCWKQNVKQVTGLPFNSDRSIYKVE